MHTNIGYAVILAFQTFHLRGQIKVAYIKLCYKTPFSNKLYFYIYFKELNQTLRVHIHTYIENASMLSI